MPLAILAALAALFLAAPAALAEPAKQPAERNAEPTAEPAPSPIPSCCLSAKATNGWCDTHHRGYVAGVEIKSEILYETLDAHGHQLDLDTFTCESCRKAIASDGFCAEHRIGFVGKLAYFSRLTYELARGERLDPQAITCPVCRKNADTRGWCDKCGVGMLGQVAIRDRQAYEASSRAVDVLISAVEVSERCEPCAVAIVTDTRCPACKITYKDGKPLGPPAAP